MPYGAGSSGVIAAPRRQVWELLSDLSAMPCWHPLVTGFVGPYGARVEPGAEFTLRLRGVGQATYRITEVRPGWQWTAVGEPLPGVTEQVEYILTEEADGTCRLYHHVRVEGPMSHLLAIFVDRAIASLPRRVEAALHALAHAAAD